MMEVRGVHPIDADEPVHLVDVAIAGKFDDVNWDAITQSDPTQPRDNWQVPYDEQELDSLPDGRARAAFFFHYLDASRPLETDGGRVDLPDISPLPSELAQIPYEAP